MCNYRVQLTINTCIYNHMSVCIIYDIILDHDKITMSAKTIIPIEYTYQCEHLL